MRANEVKEEQKGRNHVVGTLEGAKAILGFAPSLELLVEAFNQIVGDGIGKGGNPVVADTQDRLYGNLVRGKSVADNGLRLAQVLHTLQE